MTLAAVLFDLDDTLYRERSFVDGGFAAVAAFLGPRVDREAVELARRLRELHAIHGRGRLFDILLAELGCAEDRDLVLACVLVYRAHRPSLEPFEGVVETLRVLRARNVRTGLVSDGLASVQRRKLAGLPAVERELDIVVMTDELGPGQAKPSPAPFRVACRLLGASPDQVAYVANDPAKDFLGAREAGLLTIRVGDLPDVGGETMRSVPGASDADRTYPSIPDALPFLLGERSQS